MISRLFTLAILLSISTSCYSQYTRKDKSASCFEWAFGANTTHYHYTLGNKYQIGDADYLSVKNVDFRNSVGFTGGILKNFSINGRTLIRPALKFSMYKNQINYYFESHTEQFNFDVVAIEAPLHWIQTFATRNSFGRKQTYVYSVLGGSFVNELRVMDKGAAAVLNMKNQDVMLDFGIGTRLYANGKHLGAIELKYSIGLLNLYQPGYDVYQGSLEQLKRNSLSLVLQFS